MQKYIFELIKATDLFGKVNTKIAKLPNPYILTYILEAIDSISSNNIEGIHTTLDEAYEGIVRDKDTPFYMYRETLKNSRKRLMAHELIRIEDIKYINRSIRGVDGELRKGPVSIKDSEGNIVHNPPQANELPKLMEEIVQLINQDREKNQVLNALDIHHKFEHAHPFSDGNGRTGRILFALLLNKYEILETPASVFSYSLHKSKANYYKALKFADNNDQESYYEIMLELLNESLSLTIEFIEKINEKMKIYVNDDSKKSEVARYLFSGVKTTNRFISKKTGFNNKTVSKYIDILSEEGLVVKKRYDKYIAYENVVLKDIIFKTFTEIK